MKSVIDWLDERTGCRVAARKLFCDPIPGGVRWRYAWGSAVLFCIGIQFVTGIALWMGYSPSVQTAWESVNYLQNDVTGGWLLRGLHHYTAQILPVILALHLMQVVIDGAYKARARSQFLVWVAVASGGIWFLMMALTGYQLAVGPKRFLGHKSGDEHPGHRAVRRQVTANGMLIGGPDYYGQLTLTRFFGVHAWGFSLGDIDYAGGHSYLFVPATGLGRAGPASHRPKAPCIGLINF